MNALLPWPPGCSGSRLAAILGMDTDTYLRTFDRCNLVVGDWDPRSARNAAHALVQSGRDRVIMLGARVADAFGVSFSEVFDLGLKMYGGQGSEWEDIRAVRYVVLPHPSGRSRWWDKPMARERARDAVARFLEINRRQHG